VAQSTGRRSVRGDRRAERAARHTRAPVDTGAGALWQGYRKALDRQLWLIYGLGSPSLGRCVWYRLFHIARVGLVR
jgi:hypothetical protein